ncbi:small acid-soluble spore protein SspI [Paenibacillus alkalitolerans]|uniref:small acid-soluble spore protein SspI n=1 Tax=Paenibacillus alkalitolerans TaxID=2799335 RepID=UPI0018F7ABBE|nr:small acid-soluble spore protein SspI [Paenibacillus alkalitolerans]
MILTLRQAIYQKMLPMSEDEFMNTIEDAIGNDERTLPGLGVLFEIIWQNIDEDTKNKLVSTLKANFPKE